MFDVGSRKTGERAKLRSRTGMSDEQLEGWARMFERNVSFLGFLLLLLFSADVCWGWGQLTV